MTIDEHPGRRPNAAGHGVAGGGGTPSRRASRRSIPREVPMAYDSRDTDLSGDDLKVVEYSILTVKAGLKMTTSAS